MKKSIRIPLYSLFKDHPSEAKEVFSIAWPSVLESFFISLAGMIDIKMVSTMGPEAVAAVGLTTQPKFFFLAFFFAMNASVSAIVARRRGEKRQDAANATLMTAFVIAMTAVVALTVLAECVADPLMRFAGSREETHDMAVIYFRIILGGLFFNALSMIINAAQRGAGNTRIAMTSNVTSSIVNILFNYLLIGGHFGFPKMGVTGAALATVLGTVVACICCLISLFRKDGFLSLPYIFRHRIGPSREPLKAMAKVGSSIFSEQVLMRIGFAATAIMAAAMGTDPMAAHQVGMNLLGLSFSFGDGLQNAAVALTGRSLGQGDRELADRFGRLCQGYGRMISMVVAFVFLVFGKAIYGLFFGEEHIIAIGVTLSRIIALIVLLQIPQVVFMGCLRGAGDVVFTMITSTLSVTFMRTFVSWFCCYPLGLGLAGVWCGIIADQGTRLLLTTWRYSTGKWMNYKL